MDDKHEGRPSFRTSNEVRDVIDGDRQLFLLQGLKTGLRSNRRVLPIQILQM
jgi:hypothetical protein